jgi:hypothetical protein
LIYGYISTGIEVASNTVVSIIKYAFNAKNVAIILKFEPIALSEINKNIQGAGRIGYL